MRIIYRGPKLWAQLGQTSYKFLRPFLNIALGIRGSERTRVVIYNKVSEEIILVKNWIGEGKYQLPGGGLKLNEGAQQGGAREIGEELGLNLKPDQLKLIDKVKNKGYTAVFLVCELSSPLFDKNTLQIAHHEITEVVAIKLKRIGQLASKLDSITYNLLSNLKLQG